MCILPKKICQKLKEAGFPVNPTLCHYFPVYLKNDPDPHWVTNGYLPKKLQDYEIFIQNLSELITACENSFLSLEKAEKWIAKNSKKMTFSGDSPEEIIAKMYIQLKKMK